MRRGWVMLLLGLAACSPSVSFEIVFELPGAKRIYDDKLHVRGRKRCNIGTSNESIPGPPEPGVAEPYGPSAPNVITTELRREGSAIRGRFRASRCDLALTAWYDTNGDGVVGKGDYVAKVPTTEITSSAFGCTTSKNDLGVIPLRAVD